MLGLLRERGLPIDLIREAADWLMVVDRETRGRGVGVIRQLGADFGLGHDRGLVLEALLVLKATIDSSGFSNAVEARKFGLSWTSHLFDVEENLRRKLTAVSAKLPPALSSAIDKKLNEFEEKIGAKDWDACCEIMTALDHLVSDELMKTPSASHVG
ncbi:hypothetical protein [Rhizobacter sp. P5_C2]